MTNVTWQLLDVNNALYKSRLSLQVQRALRYGYYALLFLATTLFGPPGLILLWLGSIMFIPSRSHIRAWRWFPISGRTVGRVLWMQYLGFTLIASVPGLVVNVILIRPTTPLSENLIGSGLSLCIVANLAARAFIAKWDARSGVPDGASWGRAGLVANMQLGIMGGIEIGLLLASGHSRDDGPNQVFQFDTVSLYVIGLMILFAHVTALCIFSGVPAWFSKKLDLIRTKNTRQSERTLQNDESRRQKFKFILDWQAAFDLKGLYAILPIRMGILTVTASVFLIYFLRDSEFCVWLPIVPGVVTMLGWYESLKRSRLVIGCLPTDITRMILALELTAALLFVVPFGVFALVFNGPSVVESVFESASITLMVSGCMVTNVILSHDQNPPPGFTIVFVVGLLGGVAYGAVELGVRLGLLAPTIIDTLLTEATPILLVVLSVLSPVWCAGLFLITFFLARQKFMDVRLGVETTPPTKWGEVT